MRRQRDVAADSEAEPTRSATDIYHLQQTTGRIHSARAPAKTTRLVPALRRLRVQTCWGMEKDVFAPYTCYASTVQKVFALSQRLKFLVIAQLTKRTLEKSNRFRHRPGTQLRNGASLSSFFRLSISLKARARTVTRYFLRAGWGIELERKRSAACCANCANVAKRFRVESLAELALTPKSSPVLSLRPSSALSSKPGANY